MRVVNDLVHINVLKGGVNVARECETGEKGPHAMWKTYGAWRVRTAQLLFSFWQCIVYGCDFVYINRHATESGKTLKRLTKAAYGLPPSNNPYLALAGTDAVIILWYYTCPDTAVIIQPLEPRLLSEPRWSRQNEQYWRWYHSILGLAGEASCDLPTTAACSDNMASIQCCDLRRHRDEKIWRRQ